MSSSSVGSSYQGQGNDFGVRVNEGAVRAPENRSARFTIDSGVVSKGSLIATALSLVGAAGSGIGVLATKPKLFSSQRTGGYCSTVMVLFIVAAGASAFGFLVCQIIGNIYRRRAQQLVPPQAQPQAAEINLGRAPQPVAEPLPQQASQVAKDEASQQPTKEERLRGQVVAYDAALTALRQKVQKAQKFAEPLA